MKISIKGENNLVFGIITLSYAVYFSSKEMIDRFNLIVSIACLAFGTFLVFRAGRQNPKRPEKISQYGLPIPGRINQNGSLSP